MKKLVIVLALVIVVLAGAALNYHVIVLDDEVRVLRKTRMSLSDTIVDARGVNRVKLYTNPDLVKAGILKMID